MLRTGGAMIGVSLDAAALEDVLFAAFMMSRPVELLPRICLLLIDVS